jgi:DNA-binding SARP family transcriptional activator/tetratricopeptide (TPR) repeat protein/TolB-like protein
MPDPEVVLRLFGGVVVERDGAPISGRATQRRRLALLALLAAAPNGAVSRDKIIGLLWPDAETEAARHLLASAVYELRKALGDGFIVSRGDDLMLDHTRVRTDVARFAEALAHRDHASAVALYNGTFAEGLFVSGSAEFERWMDERRDRFAQAFRGALESLARTSSAAGEHVAASELWLRLVAAEAGNSRTVVSAMQSLASAGRIAAALRQAQLYESQMRQDFGADPDPAVLAYADVLRREDLRPSLNASQTEVDAALPGLRTDPVAAPDGAGVGEAAPGAGGGATRHGIRWGGSPARLLRAAGTAFGLLLLLGTGTTGRPLRSAELRPHSEGVAVLPFAVHGGAENAYLAEGIPRLLSAAMEGAADMQVIPADLVLGHVRRHPRTNDSVLVQALHGRLGAGIYVTGSVHVSSGRIRLLATARGARSATVTEAVAEGDASQLFELVDMLATRLAGSAPPTPHGRLSRAAARTTRSIAALRAFVEGEREFHAGRLVSAADSYSEAVRHDSTFALAYYRLSMATLWADQPGAAPADVDEKALRYSDDLSDHERLLVRAYLAYRRGAADEAEQIYRAVITTYPDDVEALFLLGEVFFHYNPLRGRRVSEAREPFERVLALDPDHWGALWHLAHIAAIQERNAEYRLLLDRLLALDPDAPRALEVRMLRALTHRDRADEERLTARLAQTDELRLYSILWKAAVYAGDIDGAERMAVVLTDARQPEYTRTLGSAERANLLLARGRWREAELLMTSNGSWSRAHGIAVEARARLSTLPWRTEDPSHTAQNEDLLRFWSSIEPETRQRNAFYWSGLMAAQRGDGKRARWYASRLDSLMSAHATDSLAAALDRRAAMSVRGHALMRSNAAEALRLLDAVPLERFHGLAVTNPVHSGSAERFARAVALARLGRAEEALGWFAGFAEHAPHDLAYLGPSLYARAELSEQLGRIDDAIALYGRFAALWRDCDPELRPRVLEAHQRMERLHATHAPGSVRQP